MRIKYDLTYYEDLTGHKLVPRCIPMINTELTKAVEALLALDPDWFLKIDLDRLAMGNGSFSTFNPDRPACIMCQLSIQWPQWFINHIKANQISFDTRENTHNYFLASWGAVGHNAAFSGELGFWPNEDLPGQDEVEFAFCELDMIWTRIITDLREQRGANAVV